MCNDVSPARSGRELFEATRPFAVESPVRSWVYVGSTFTMLVVVLTAAALVPWWPVRLALSLLGGLLAVRAFILFHDFQHGSLLRGSRAARILFHLFGLLALTPPNVWRRSHNFHHAHVEKPMTPSNDGIALLTSGIGSFPLMTTESWRRATWWQRFRYRAVRHPLTILFGYFTVFLGGFCIAPLVSSPRRNLECAMSLLLHFGLLALIWYLAGPTAVFFGLVLPFGIAAALGGYLFLVQHNAEGVDILSPDEWTYYRGSLESSTYMELGPVMHWFTANIGYHHVHHLNALIPFYRLPETMVAIPELQNPIRTSLRAGDVLNCLQLALWDPSAGQLVSLRDARRLATTSKDGGKPASSPKV